MHAILFRKWKQRIKGRDFYDLLWYIGQNTPVNLGYLENKMRDGKSWQESRKMTRDDLMQLLETRIKTIDFQAAAQDVAVFIKDPNEVIGWSQELFLAAVKTIKTESD